MKVTSNIAKVFVLLFLWFFFVISFARAENYMSLDIYHIEPSLAESFDVIERDTDLSLVLLDDVSTRGVLNSNQVNFKVDLNDNSNIKASGYLTSLKPGSRLSMLSEVRLSTNKLYLSDGQEVDFISSSPLFQASHPSHANSSLLGFITRLATASSPLTLGAGLGVGFLVNGLLSARKNGYSDFIWGGLNGSGLSFLERIFRKQPDVFLEKGTIIPFTLKEDLKISKGVTKEMDENIKLSEEGSMKRIQRLLEWGDLAGALELSAKSEQKETYNNLMKKLPAGGGSASGGRIEN